jgi:hypothetical protein
VRPTAPLLLLACLWSASGCGDAPDCAKYAEKLATLNTAGLAGDDLEKASRTVRVGAEGSCRAGKVKREQIDCVLAAATADDARRCAGLSPLGGASAVPAAPPASEAVAKRKGFSLPVPAGWKEEGGGNPEVSELLLRPVDPARKYDGVMISRVPKPPLGLSDDAACRQVAQRLLDRNPALTLRSARVIQTGSGPACETILADPDMVIHATGFAAAGGSETISFTCFYPVASSAPPAFCGESLRSLQVD